MLVRGRRRGHKPRGRVAVCRPPPQRQRKSRPPHHATERLQLPNQGPCSATKRLCIFPRHCQHDRV
eukprot:7389395-Prymnesium_polylepis.1